MMEAVTLEDVRRVAELASLELSTGEEASMLRDLNAILEYVQQLNELDTGSTEPMAQVSELATESMLRSDEIRPSLPREQVMASAPETDGAFFKVPKVIER